MSHPLDTFSDKSVYVAPAIQIMRLRMKKDLIHDTAHIVRVVKMTLYLAEDTEADLDILLPAAILHDLVNVPKTSWENRKSASRKSSETAIRMLSMSVEPKSPDHFDQIAHAIDAHSFSAGIEPKTLEAAIVQDADRLDSIGLIGVARCISYSGKIDRTLSHPTDPLARHRTPDEYTYCLDHFVTKLNTLVGLLRTPKARLIGERRHAKMIQFQTDISREILGLD